jgi:hypothetical protein
MCHRFLSFEIKAFSEDRLQDLWREFTGFMRKEEGKGLLYEKL